MVNSPSFRASSISASDKSMLSLPATTPLIREVDYVTSILSRSDSWISQVGLPSLLVGRYRIILAPAFSGLECWHVGHIFSQRGGWNQRLESVTVDHFDNFRVVSERSDLNLSLFQRNLQVAGLTVPQVWLDSSLHVVSLSRPIFEADQIRSAICAGILH